jgi:hypothetical protein
MACPIQYYAHPAFTNWELLRMPVQVIIETNLTAVPYLCGSGSNLMAKQEKTA